MPFPRDLLNTDEEIVLDLRPHWWSITPASVYLAVALVVGLVVLLQDDSLFWNMLRVVVGLGVLAALVHFGVVYARWATTNFVVTTTRVASRRGIVAKTGVELRLDRISSIACEQSFFEQLIGTGHLTIESVGDGGRKTFPNLPEPEVVQQEIYRRKEAYESRKGAAGDAPPGARAGSAPPTGPSIPDQIEHLDRLRRSGAITEEEFQASKAELLKRL